MGIKITKKTAKKINSIFVILLLECLVFGCWIGVSINWNNLYDRENFNCREMSVVVGMFFKRMGIPVKILHGYGTKTIDNITIGHAWLILFDWLEFESTTLKPQFVNKNSEKYTVYSITEVP